MPRNFRQSVLLSLMLGFIPAGTLASFAVLLPSEPVRGVSQAQPAARESLYRRLGGYDALAAVTDDFLGRLAADPKLGRFFVGLSTDSRTRVRQHIVDFLCMATGGPCKYVGRDMQTVHTGLGITEDDWSTMVRLLGETLNKFKVAAAEQQDVLNALAPLKSQIVGK
jgi:hemoglobin